MAALALMLALPVAMFGLGFAAGAYHRTRRITDRTLIVMAACAGIDMALLALSAW